MAAPKKGGRTTPNKRITNPVTSPTPKVVPPSIQSPQVVPTAGPQRQVTFTPIPTGDPGSYIGKQHFPQVSPFILELQKQRGSKIITYFLSERHQAAIGEDVIRWFYEHLIRIGHQPRIDLFLVTRGGATEVPWRIVTLFREFTDHLGILVPFLAQSAGTHICLGADEIVMTELSQLGPVDPSRSHPLLPTDPYVPQGQSPRPLSISVQDLRQFIKFVAEDSGDGLTVQDPTLIYTELMKYVHPLVIGAMEQTYSLARELTKSMLELHMDGATEAEQIEALSQRFADDYKIHSYPIARKEARNLGLNITDASEPLRDAMWNLWKHYSEKIVHLDAQSAAIGTGATKKALGLDAASYVDSEVGTAIGFRVVDGSGKVEGSQWFSWFS
jgi:hypothetical protein